LIFWGYKAKLKAKLKASSVFQNQWYE